MAGADLPDLLPHRSAGARPRAGTAALASARSGQPETRPLGPWAFTAVAVASFGGPLSLAALNAPGLLGGASDSAGLAMLAGAAAFALPLAVWLGYARHVHGPGGLYGYVEAAAGPRLAVVQAAIWIVSYLLYLVYTTVQIVYDLLPSVVPGEGRYQTLLALAIPVAMVAVMLAGRAAIVAVLGLIAAGQLALAGVLDGVTLSHLSTPASSFGAGAASGPFAKAGAQTSLLYICGSLPLFLGGELARPSRTIRRGVLGAFGVTALVVTLAVAPLAAAPGLSNTAVPGVSVAQQFAGAGVAKAIGIGVAASIAGVMVCEYLALTRLVHALTARSVHTITAAIAVPVLIGAPVVLIDPSGIYNALLKPSLVALWLSQLIVFAVYPRFARAHARGGRAASAWLLSAGACALALYGLWTGVQASS